VVLFTVNVNGQTTEKYMPSLKDLRVIYEKFLDWNDMPAAKKVRYNIPQKYGFTYVTKKNKRFESEYDDGGLVTQSKFVYRINYTFFDIEKSTDVKGFMEMSLVYGYGDPGMYINCDNGSWKNLKEAAEQFKKKLDENSYILNEDNYISFKSAGIIEITAENTHSW